MVHIQLAHVVAGAAEIGRCHNLVSESIYRDIAGIEFLGAFASNDHERPCMETIPPVTVWGGGVE